MDIVAANTSSSDEFSMVMNLQTNRLYILMGSIGTPQKYECRKVLDVSYGHLIQQFELQRNPYSIGGVVQLVNVNGRIHRIGGHQTHHAIWNEADGIWDEKEHHQSLWEIDLHEDAELIYVKSKNSSFDLTFRVGMSKMSTTDAKLTSNHRNR